MGSDQKERELAAEAGSHYDAFYGPFYFEPYALEIARLVPDAVSGTVLELAAGTGRVTRHLRRVLPATTRLVASDIDEGMLSVARKKVGGNTEWAIIDAQQLPFETGSVAMVVCAFGYMFVDDRVKALAEAFRVLRSGGMLVFTTWDRLENNPASLIAKQVAAKYTGENTEGDENRATSLSNPDELKELLKHAGFSGILVSRSVLEGRVISARDAAIGFSTEGFYKELAQSDPALLRAIRDEIENGFAKKFGVSPMVAPISAFLCQAWK